MSDMAEIFSIWLKIVIGLAVAGGIAVGAIAVGLFNWLT